MHRDLKPANILITGRDHPKILDFGLASGAVDGTDQDLTKTGVVLGTAGYMSPEQEAGKPLDARTDLFSFGLVLYEMATGLHLKGAVRLRADAPPELERIISKCLEPAPGLRYQHASNVRADLQRLKRDSDSGLTATSAQHAAKRWPLIVPAAAVVLVFCVAGYFYLHRTPKLTDKDTIVLADFTTTTGDPVFDGTLRQGLAVQLEQSPFLRLVSEARIERTRASLMGQPAWMRGFTPEVAKEVCERTGGAAVLEGSIASLGEPVCVGITRQELAAAVTSSTRSRAKRQERKTC